MTDDVCEKPRLLELASLLDKAEMFQEMVTRACNHGFYGCEIKDMNREELLFVIGCLITHHYRHPALDGVVT